MVFFYISHCLQAFILPPGITILLGGLGLALLKSYFTLGRVLIISSIALLWLLSTPVVAEFLISSLMKNYPPLDIHSEIAPAKAVIIVLGGGAHRSPEFKNNLITNEITLNRLRYAVFLHQHLHLPLITSGGKIVNYEQSEAQLMEQDLRNFFKVKTAFLEDKSITTRDEANYLRPLLQEQGIQKAYIVTDAWHMPRTINVFRFFFKNTGIEFIPAPVWSESAESPSRFLNLLPSARALQLSNIVLHEQIGAFAYALANWCHPQQE